MKNSDKREKRVIRMQHERRWVWRGNHTGESGWSRGKWHRRWVWTYWGEQIDPGKSTKQQSDGQVFRKTRSQMDGQTALAMERVREMKRKKTNKKTWLKREEMERCQWAGFHLAPTPPVFLLLENWSVNTVKSSRNSTSSVTAMVTWSLGTEKDGLVHFYCLANAPTALSAHQSFTVHSYSPVSCPLVLSFLLPNSPFPFPILRSPCLFSIVSPLSLWAQVEIH